MENNRNWAGIAALVLAGLALLVALTGRGAPNYDFSAHMWGGPANSSAWAVPVAPGAAPAAPAEGSIAPMPAMPAMPNVAPPAVGRVRPSADADLQAKIAQAQADAQAKIAQAQADAAQTQAQAQADQAQAQADAAQARADAAQAQADAQAQVAPGLGKMPVPVKPGAPGPPFKWRGPFTAMENGPSRFGAFASGIFHLVQLILFVGLLFFIFRFFRRRQQMSARRMTQGPPPPGPPGATPTIQL